jgi:hypothetical protein
MNLDEQVSHMMNELEPVQDTLAKLMAVGDMTACSTPKRYDLALWSEREQGS